MTNTTQTEPAPADGFCAVCKREDWACTCGDVPGVDNDEEDDSLDADGFDFMGED